MFSNDNIFVTVISLVLSSSVTKSMKILFTLHLYKCKTITIIVTNIGFQLSTKSKELFFFVLLY